MSEVDLSASARSLKKECVQLNVTPCLLITSGKIPKLFCMLKSWKESIRSLVYQQASDLTIVGEPLSKKKKHEEMIEIINASCPWNRMQRKINKFKLGLVLNIEQISLNNCQGVFLPFSLYMFVKKGSSILLQLNIRYGKGTAACKTLTILRFECRERNDHRLANSCPSLILLVEEDFVSHFFKQDIVHWNWSSFFQLFARKL